MGAIPECGHLLSKLTVQNGYQATEQLVFEFARFVDLLDSVQPTGFLRFATSFEVARLIAVVASFGDAGVRDLDLSSRDRQKFRDVANQGDDGPIHIRSDSN